MGISALVVINIAALIIVCVADDVRAAILIDCQVPGPLTHRNKTIDRDFFRAVV